MGFTVVVNKVKILLFIKVGVGPGFESHSSTKSPMSDHLLHQHKTRALVDAHNLSYIR